MWLIIGAIIGLGCLFFFPWGPAVGGGMVLGALFWIIDLLTQIRDRLPPSPAPPKRDPDAWARQEHGLPRRVAPISKYHRRRPQKGE